MRFLTKALGPAFLTIVVGLALLITSVSIDYYALTRAEWYLGEIGLVAITFGTILSFAATFAVLWSDREPPNDGAL